MSMRYTRMVLLMVVACFAITPAAWAETYTVTGLGDGGTCTGTTCTTVRAAVEAANLTTTVDDVIELPAGQIQLASQALNITDEVTINGFGDGTTLQTTIVADPGVEARAVVISNTTAVINDLALLGGKALFGINGPHGGTLLAQKSTVSLTRVRVSGGSALSGGGIANNSGTMTIDQSLIDGNFATQGGGDGGGIINFGGDGNGAASLTIRNSTIAFNNARLAGAIISREGDQLEHNQNTLVTENVTIAQNRASDRGVGGVLVGSGTWTSTSSLVADNFFDQTTASDCSGTDATSQGFNFETLGECGFNQASDKRQLVARLDTVLDDNGGPTPTMRLLAGSPALSIRTAGCTGVDQRGFQRPQGSGCDAGAFESALPPAAPTVITSPAAESATNDLLVDVRGTGTPAVDLVFYLGDQIVDEGSVDDVGQWSRVLELPSTDGPVTIGVQPEGGTRVDVRIFVDRTDPVTTIYARPPAATNRGDVTFTFAANDPGSTYECALRRVGDSDPAPSACLPGGVTYSGLANGDYSFSVRATDRAGNLEEVPVTADFTVDAGLIAQPTVADPAVEPNAATLSFATTQAERSFRCRLEGPDRDGAFQDCASPQRYDGLAAGDYTFTVRSSDRAGNFADSSPRAFSVAGPPAQAQPVPTAGPVANPAATPAPTPTPTPTVGEDVVIRPTGRVLVKVPGTNQFIPVNRLEDVPLGSEIDTTNGRVVLRFESEKGKVQTATFYGGVFRITQVGKILDLKLTEPLAACPKQGKAATAQSKKKAKKRRLWGDGKGSFRTSGKYSAATVRGTKWLVEDSCAGTLTRVATGVVQVKHGKKKILLRAGKRYLAKAPR